jgi:hypothetical protein
VQAAAAYHEELARVQKRTRKALKSFGAHLRGILVTACAGNVKLAAAKYVGLEANSTSVRSREAKLMGVRGFLRSRMEVLILLCSVLLHLHITNRPRTAHAHDCYVCVFLPWLI